MGIYLKDKILNVASLDFVCVETYIAKKANRNLKC